MSQPNQSEGRKDNAAVPDHKVLDQNAKSGGEKASFKENEVPGKDDLTGPAGDPAEGKRPGGSSYPA